MPKQAFKHISGEFIIPIGKVGPDGMDISPSSSSSSGSGETRGPKPKPYLEKKARAQRLEAAMISRGRDPAAVYHAAYSKASKDTRFVMKRMKEDPNLASEIRKWYPKYKANKRMYISQYFNSISTVL